MVVFDPCRACGRGAPCDCPKPGRPRGELSPEAKAARRPPSVATLLGGAIDDPHARIAELEAVLRDWMEADIRDDLNRELQRIYDRAKALLEGK